MRTSLYKWFAPKHHRTNPSDIKTDAEYISGLGSSSNTSPKIDAIPNMHYNGMDFEIYAQHLRQILPTRIEAGAFGDRTESVQTALRSFDKAFSEAENTESIKGTYKTLLSELSVGSHLKAADRKIRNWAVQENLTTRQIQQYVNIHDINKKVDHITIYIEYLADNQRLQDWGGDSRIEHYWVAYSSALREHATPDIVIEKLKNLIAALEAPKLNGTSVDHSLPSMGELKNKLSELQGIFESTGGRNYLKRLNVIYRRYRKIEDLWTAWKGLKHPHRTTALQHHRFEVLMEHLTSVDKHYNTKQVSEAAQAFFNTIDPMVHSAETMLDRGGKKRRFITSYNLRKHNVFLPEEVRPLKKALYHFVHEKWISAQRIDDLWHNIENIDLMPDEANKARLNIIELMKPKDYGKSGHPTAGDLSFASLQLILSLDKAERQDKRHKLSPKEIQPLRNELKEYLTVEDKIASEVITAWNAMFPANDKEKRRTAYNDDLNRFMVNQRQIVAGIENPMDRHRAIRQNVKDLIGYLNLRQSASYRKCRLPPSILQEIKALKNRIGMITDNVLSVDESRPKALVIDNRDSRLRYMATADKKGKYWKTGESSSTSPFPEAPHCDDVEASMILDYESLFKGMDEVLNKFNTEADTAGLELSDNTINSWYAVVVEIHRKNEPEKKIEALNRFADAYKADWKKISKPLDPGMMLHKYARNLAHTSQVDNAKFNTFMGKLNIAPIMDLDRALERALALPKLGTKRGGTKGVESRGMRPLISKIVAADITGGSILAMRPRAGGLDFPGKLSEKVVGPLFTAGLCMYHSLSTVQQISDRIKLRKVRKEGAGKTHDAKQMLDHLSAQQLDGYIMMKKIAEELKLNLGETLEAKGTQTLWQDIELSIDVPRRIITSALTIAATAHPAPLVGLTIASAVLNLLGGGTSIYDHVTGMGAAVAADRYTALVSGNISALVNKFDAEEKGLDTGLKGLVLQDGLEKIKEDKMRDARFFRSLSTDETLFSISYFISAINAAISAATSNAVSNEVGRVVGQVLNYSINAHIGVFCLWATVSVARHIYGTSRSVINEGQANHAFRALMAYKDTVNDEDKKRPFNLYKLEYGTNTISAAVKDINKSAAVLSPKVRKKCMDIMSVVNEEKTKFPVRDPKSVEFADFFEQIRSNAGAIGEKIPELHTLIAESYKEYIQGQLLGNDRANVFFNYGRIEEHIVNIDHTSSTNGGESSLASNRHVSTAQEVFGCAHAVLEGALKTMSDNIEKNPRRQGAKRIRTTLENTAIILSSGDLQTASENIVAIANHPVFYGMANMGRNFRTLLKSTAGHVKLTTKMALHTDQLHQISKASEDGHEDTEGLHLAAATHTRNNLLRWNKGAFPAAVLWFIQSSNPQMVRFGSELLRGFGIKQKTLSRLIRQPDSREALAMVAQVIESPHTLDRKGVYASPVSDLSLGDALESSKRIALNELQKKHPQPIIV